MSMHRPAQRRDILFHQLLQCLDAGKQAEPVDADAYGVKRLTTFKCDGAVIGQEAIRGSRRGVDWGSH